MSKGHNIKNAVKDLITNKLETTCMPETKLEHMVRENSVIARSEVRTLIVYICTNSVQRELERAKVGHIAVSHILPVMGNNFKKIGSMVINAQVQALGIKAG